MRSLN